MELQKFFASEANGSIPCTVCSSDVFPVPDRKINRGNKSTKTERGAGENKNKNDKQERFHRELRLDLGRWKESVSSRAEGWVHMEHPFFSSLHDSHIRPFGLALR